MSQSPVSTPTDNAGETSRQESSGGFKTDNILPSLEATSAPTSASRAIEDEAPSATVIDPTLRSPQSHAAPEFFPSPEDIWAIVERAILRVEESDCTMEQLAMEVSDILRRQSQAMRSWRIMSDLGQQPALDARPTSESFIQSPPGSFRQSSSQINRQETLDGEGLESISEPIDDLGALLASTLHALDEISAQPNPNSAQATLAISNILRTTSQQILAFNWLNNAGVLAGSLPRTWAHRRNVRVSERQAARRLLRRSPVRRDPRRRLGDTIEPSSRLEFEPNDHDQAPTLRGLRKFQIRRILAGLKTTSVKGLADADTGSAPAQCAICLMAYKPRQHINILPCHPSHHFHRKCLRAWLANVDNCPVCRATVETPDTRECLPI